MANRPVSAMSRHETDLINKSRRALASGRVEDSVEKLRHLCLARGASGERKLRKFVEVLWKLTQIFVGILGLGRCFRRIDDNGDKQLNLEEFAKGLRDTGLEVDDAEAQEIFNQFDTDGSGTINMTEFLVGIRVRNLNCKRVRNLINFQFPAVHVGIAQKNCKAGFHEIG